MKKGVITVGIPVVVACAVTAYCWAAGRENRPEDTTETGSVQQVKTVANAGKGKSLVVYFSVPELSEQRAQNGIYSGSAESRQKKSEAQTDGLDASSGASRVIAGGKMMGNTAYVAAVISEATGGDLFEIKTVRPYPGSHKALIDAAKVEIDNKARPKLATHIENPGDYDVVFVGFPNWWYDMPMPLYSFFDEYDFSGKTVIPFCTHGGSRFSGAIETIRELEPQATVLDGYSVARDRVAHSKEGVLKWLEKIGMKK